MSRAVVLVLAVTSIIVPCWDSARAAPLSDQEVVRKILADFQARQRYVKTIRYSAIGTVTVGQGVHTGEPGSPEGAISPATDVTCEQKRNWLIDFEQGLIRKESWHPAWSPEKQRFLFRYEMSLFDGETLRQYRPMELNTAMESPNPEDERELLRYARERAVTRLWHIADQPLQYGHGLFSLRGISEPELRIPFDESMFRLVARLPAEESSIFGQVVVRVEPTATSTFAGRKDLYVDLDRQSAVFRAIHYSGDTPFRTQDIAYQITDVGWLPHKWTCTALDSKGGLICAWTMEIIDYSIDPVTDASDFTVTPRPGSVVLDTDGKDYRVGSDGRLTLLRSSTPGRSGPSSGSYRLWMSVTSMVLLGLIALAVWKGKAKLQSI